MLQSSLLSLSCWELCSHSQAKRKQCELCYWTHEHEINIVNIKHGKAMQVLWTWNLYNHLIGIHFLDGKTQWLWFHVFKFIVWWMEREWFASVCLCIHAENTENCYSRSSKVLLWWKCYTWKVIIITSWQNDFWLKYVQCKNFRKFRSGLPKNHAASSIPKLNHAKSVWIERSKYSDILDICLFTRRGYLVGAWLFLLVIFPDEHVWYWDWSIELNWRQHETVRFGIREYLSGWTNKFLGNFESFFWKILEVFGSFWKIFGNFVRFSMMIYENFRKLFWILLLRVFRNVRRGLETFETFLEFSFPWRVCIETPFLAQFSKIVS